MRPESAPSTRDGRPWLAFGTMGGSRARVADEVARELQRKGRPVRMLEDWDDNMGHARAIRTDPEEGFPKAARALDTCARHRALAEL